MSELWKIFIAAAGGAIVSLLATQLDWVRFRKKDKADVKKVESEIEVDQAEIINREVDAEIKISKAALEWTVQLAGQLDKANMINEKQQNEITKLQGIIINLREDINKLSNELKRVDELLEITREELDNERLENIAEIERLKNHINNGGKI